MSADVLKCSQIDDDVKISLGLHKSDCGGACVSFFSVWNWMWVRGENEFRIDWTAMIKKRSSKVIFRRIAK